MKAKKSFTRSRGKSQGYVDLLSAFHVLVRAAENGSGAAAERLRALTNISHAMPSVTQNQAANPPGGMNSATTRGRRRTRLIPKPRTTTGLMILRNRQRGRILKSGTSISQPCLSASCSMGVWRVALFSLVRLHDAAAYLIDQANRPESEWEGEDFRKILDAGFSHDVPF